MNTKTTIVLTGFVAIAPLAATMAMKVQLVYAPGGMCVGCTPSLLQPGHLLIIEQAPSAKFFAPGIIAAETGQPASQLAPGQEAKVNSPG
jgi:hypothetical protein